MKPDYDLISGALKSWYYNFVGELVLSAKNTYVATSIAADSLALKRHGIVSDELRELGFEKAKKIDAPMLKEMKDLYSEKSREFTDPYKADLMNGGRFVNIGKWGDLNDDKFREYEGYERKWVPWLENYDKTQREAIYGIVTSGKSKEEIAEELERNFNMRKNYAQMVARTESYNNSAIIKRDRWDKAGYEFFKWICSHSTNSPCLILCAQFCGRTFHRSELPFNGELAHANCRCTTIPVLKDTIPDEWKNLKPESTWAERNGDEPRFVPPEYKSPFLKDNINRQLPDVPILDSDLPGKFKLDKGIDEVLKDVVGTWQKKSVDDIYNDVVGVYARRKGEYQELKLSLKNMKDDYVKIGIRDLNLIVDRMNANLTNPVEYAKYKSEYDALRKKLTENKAMWPGIELKLQNMRADGKKEIIELLKTGETNKIPVNLSQFKIVGESDKIKEGVDFLESVASKDLVDSIPHSEVAFKKIPIGDRAGASRAGGYIEIAVSDGPEIAVHEMGHIFDGLNDSDRFNHALDFYRRRTKGFKFEEIWPGSGEYAKKDNFIEMYTGKQYLSNSSEVTSMGLQHLYEMPGEFAMKDPDHFRYIMRVLRYDLT